jgi:hypothetical protein
VGRYIFTGIKVYLRSKRECEAAKPAPTSRS